MLLQKHAIEDLTPDRYSVREASPGDTDRLRQMFSRCSVETIYERFHSPYPVVPAWMADLMIGVDDGEAFVVVAGDEIVGHAMYVLADGRDAEVAVVVEDGWQSRGVGGRLLSATVEHARLRGVEAFVCETLAENRRVPGLSVAVFSRVERKVEGGTCRIRVPLKSLRSERGVS